MDSRRPPVRRRGGRTFFTRTMCFKPQLAIRKPVSGGALTAGSKKEEKYERKTGYTLSHLRRR